MGQTESIILIVGIIVTLGTIAFTIQTMEERKQARKRLVLSYKGQIRDALNIYKSLPDVIMTLELHDFISRYILKKWNKLHEINTTQDSLRSLNTFQERIKNRVITQQLPQGSMTVYQEEGQVYHTLGLLKETTRWLGELSKSKQISESAFNELGWLVKDFYDRVSCDIEIFDAQETLRQHGEKAGFHKFTIALRSLSNLNQSEALDAQIFEIHKLMEKLRTVIEEQKAEEERLRIEKENEGEERK